jgi:hypothetical protein
MFTRIPNIDSRLREKEAAVFREKTRPATSRITLFKA